jgi:hypothetical protein
MKLPRWTVYPALALIASLIVTAVPQAGYAPLNEGAAARAREAYLQRAAAVAGSERVELRTEREQRKPTELPPASSIIRD